MGALVLGSLNGGFSYFGYILGAAKNSKQSAGSAMRLSDVYALTSSGRCMYACVCIYMDSGIVRNGHEYIVTNTYIHVYIHVQTFIYKNIYMCIHTYNNCLPIRVHTHRE